MAEVLLEIVEVEGAIDLVDIDGMHGYAFVLGHQVPRRVVGIVVELGQDDLVTGLQRLPKRAAEREGERGHVGPKIHLFAVLGVEHVGHPFVRRHNNGVGFVAGHELPVCVGIRAGEVFDDAVDTGLRHLGAGGAVEENVGAAML